MRVELSGSGRKVQAENRMDMKAQRISRQLAFTLIEFIVNRCWLDPRIAQIGGQCCAGGRQRPELHRFPSAERIA
jgi:hypothetical protein